MATLTVATKANGALVFPGVLAAAGDSAIDTSVVPFLVDYASSTHDSKRSQINEWVQRSITLSVSDFNSLKQPMHELDSHLILRSYIVGHSLTLADILIWASLHSNKATSSLRKTSTNITRWYTFIEHTNPWLETTISDLTRTARRHKAAASAAGASYNIGLKHTANRIVTRFPPEPSGYLHIGHAKAALLNDYFAHEYASERGVLICRFDDTNPSRESSEFQDSILRDLELLGVRPDRVSYSSDYFQQMYEGCVRLIRLGKAYADNTPKEVMQDQRRDGVPSACRDMSIKDTLSHLENMKSGSSEGQKWCIRARISVDNPNKALRDPVIYRCNLQPHHRTGTIWSIYPTYDFCAPFLDALEGVTHALRTNEYRDRNPQYQWLQQALSLREVDIWDFSRLSFVRTVLSKRKLSLLVEKGVVSGWDDPRMPTVRGIRRRGITVPALREFILKQGPSQNIVNLDWTAFWATNKKYIDPVAPRHTAIASLNAVVATIDGVTKMTSEEKPRHNKNASLGTKKVFFGKEIFLAQDDAASLKPDEEFTLMNWGNAIVTSITADPHTGTVQDINLRLHLRGDFKKTDKKLTWLAREPTNTIPVDLVYFDHLINKDKLENGDDLLSCVTPRSEVRVEAWADCGVAGLVEDDIVQLDRVGYFRVDCAYKFGGRTVLFNIPAGKGSSLGGR
ncbi:glutamyl-tRNA synthetase [Aspergillus campestris IBT 28561]|uniref:glutamate--tRNA ligase n=1 Tax=Aspergillus campestris (strain IBT 28561) TaxID=1392248 RepID=A0A2I1CSK3_ASPC2|nr:glutamyl-tRNA synthetase [Aspergillus campestris IBT 28561]PKY00598.1 glutamyl-tRNA synthetase [Aspergillus campestris IBT 28561]